jgi:hypothetical protein
MCFRRSRYLEQRADEVQSRRLWDLFYRETEGSEPPLPVAERDEEVPVSERDRDEVPAGAER